MNASGQRGGESELREDFFRQSSCPTQAKKRLEWATSPDAGLVVDAAGNLYGSTNTGGTGNESNPLYPGGGVTFELSPPLEKGGAWTETVLYNFCSEFVNDVCLDGGPGGTSQMAFDKGGNLYGTAALGGLGQIQGQGVRPGGGGIVFELSPKTGGWNETFFTTFVHKVVAWIVLMDSSRMA